MRTKSRKNDKNTDISRKNNTNPVIKREENKNTVTKRNYLINPDGSIRFY